MRCLFSCFCSNHLGPQSLHSRILGSAGRGWRKEVPTLLGERLCLAGLFCFWAVLSRWLYSWLLSRAFLAQIVCKARQAAAENIGSHCSSVLCLLQDQRGSGTNGRLAGARGCLAALKRVIISNDHCESSKCKDKCQGKRTR